MKTSQAMAAHNSIHRDIDKHLYRSIVNVPDHKVGAGRTRVLLSHDDMQGNLGMNGLQSAGLQDETNL